MATNTDERTLADKHADSMIQTIRERSDAGAPFGHRDDHDEWHDVDECQDDCEGIPASAMDYLSDVLDINYVVTSDRAYRSARILIGFGGPNVWIDTGARELQVFWDNSAVRALPLDFVDELDDALQELWEAGS